MYDAGAAPYFDILAIHAYGWHFDPDAPADPAVVNFRRTELLRHDHGGERRRAPSRP
jgi:hypothetical protein